MLPTNELKEICKRSIKHEEENFKNLFIFLKKFNEEIDKKRMIILVHPGEEKKIYLDKINDLKNVNIAEGDFSSNSWILASELIIQNNCTTSVEAILLGKKSLQLNTYQDELVEYDLPKKVSKNFHNNDDLIRYLKNFKTNDFKNTFEYKDILSFLKNYIENVDNVTSIDLTLKHLNNYIQGRKITKSKFFFFKSIHKLKILKRKLKSKFQDMGKIKLSDSKFSGLEIKEIEFWLNNIAIADNLKSEDFSINENLPGLFTIKYKEKN